MTEATDKIKSDLEATALTRHNSLKDNFRSTLDELSRGFVPQANTVIARTTHTPSGSFTRFSTSPARVSPTHSDSDPPPPRPHPSSQSSSDEDTQEDAISIRHSEGEFSEREEPEMNYFTTAEKTIHFKTVSEEGISTIQVHERYNTISKLLNIELIEEAEDPPDPRLLLNPRRWRPGTTRFHPRQ